MQSPAPIGLLTAMTDTGVPDCCYQRPRWTALVDRGAISAAASTTMDTRSPHGLDNISYSCRPTRA